MEFFHLETTEARVIPVFASAGPRGRLPHLTECSKKVILFGYRRIRQNSAWSVKRDFLAGDMKRADQGPNFVVRQPRQSHQVANRLPARWYSAG